MKKQSEATTQPAKEAAPVKKQSVAITQPAKEAAPMKLLRGSDLFDRIQNLFNSIARRAKRCKHERQSSQRIGNFCD